MSGALRETLQVNSGRDSRSWPDETGAPMKVHQELMGHGLIQAISVDGQPMTSSRREVNSKVGGMVLKPAKASA